MPTALQLETQATYETLNDYLDSLLTLRSTYEAYQLSYNALVLEMDRRRRYRDGMEAVVQDMRDRLARLRDGAPCLANGVTFFFYRDADR